MNGPVGNSILKAVHVHLSSVKINYDAHVYLCHLLLSSPCHQTLILPDKNSFPFICFPSNLAVLWCFNTVCSIANNSQLKSYNNRKNY